MNTAHSSNDMESSQATFAGAVACSDLATDETLVATAQMGDERAFETLVKRHRPRIFAIALRYTRVREDAEDVVQQTLQKTFVYLNNFEGKSSFSTWLTRIAINEALMCLRRARALREVSIDDLNGDEETGPHFNIADESQPRGHLHAARGGADFVDHDQTADPENAKRARAEGTPRIIGSRDGPTNGSVARGCQSSGVPRQKEATEPHHTCRRIPKVQKGFSTIVIACQQQSEGLLTFSPSG
jgi:RNA polymerase sigma factor (sigma-70 family)